MSGRIRALWGRLLHRIALRHWTLAADAAESADLPVLRLLRGRARVLRRQIDRLLYTADSRLALPLIGSSAMPRPLGTDWAWRPDLWRGPLAVPGVAGATERVDLAPGTTLFHDCPRQEIALRQIRNTGASDLAPFGLRIDVFRFDGGFLSVVLDLPDEAAQGLEPRHLVRLDAVIDCESTLSVFVRLNVRHGPNTEELVQQAQAGRGTVTAEFDLAGTRLEQRRVDRVWVDLILDRPGMNRITLRDVTLTRRPRAEL